MFLINHGMRDQALLATHETVADAHPGRWAGVHCLGRSAERVFREVSPTVRGVWGDNAGIVENRETQEYAERVLASRQACAPDCLYFGGVAFKHQRHVDDLEAAGRISAR